MTLRDALFPSDPANPHVLMQTAWIGSWESQFLGLGRLTTFLGNQLPAFSAADDDLGLGVVFLHRHHAEVGLKLVLERAEADVPKTHQLDDLSCLCEEALRTCGLGAEWTSFWEEQSEYLTLLQEIDAEGFAYRYPSDRKGRPVERPPFIDLAELARAGGQFQASVMRLVDLLARSELLELAENEVEPTVQEVSTAVRAIRSTLQFTEAMATVISRSGEQMGLAAMPPTPEIAAARSKRDVQTELLRRLEPPLLRLVDQLTPRRPADAPALQLDPGPLAPEPKVQPGPPQEMRKGMLAVEKWIATGLGAQLRTLKPALIAVRMRSSGWSGSAGRQIHRDVARFLSRF